MKRFFLSLIILSVGASFADTSTSKTSCLTGKVGNPTLVSSQCDSTKPVCGGKVVFKVTAPCTGTTDGKPDASVCESATVQKEIDGRCDGYKSTVNGQAVSVCYPTPNGVGAPPVCRCKTGKYAPANCTTGNAL